MNEDRKNIIVLGLRVIQLLTLGVFVSGFVWGSSDWLLATVLVGVPITPLSVLMMLYGSVGSIVVEVTIRVLKKN